MNNIMPESERFKSGKEIHDAEREVLEACVEEQKTWDIDAALDTQNMCVEYRKKKIDTGIYQKILEAKMAAIAKRDAAIRRYRALLDSKEANRPR